MCDYTAAAPLPTLEKDTLVQLYSMWGGPNWYNKAGWLTSDHPCTWHGVVCACSNPPQVTELQLGINNLVGPFTSLLANFAKLS